ncbi:MAG TPA: sigma-70 family RNA polymerase sigma factor [Clostridia bacterium]|nr:sigma-70 family RNA polymerase sigma factor [Clostridia bacterium]
MSSTPDSRGSTTGASSAHASPAFTTTHWSVVLSARDRTGPASVAALEKLCRAYWQPLYAFARRCGHSPTDAEDLTQGFFARLLEKDFLLKATSEKGKFRSFLLLALKRFMANEWDRQHAQKRGGFATFIEMDSQLAESRLVADDPALQPDQLFDRQWALTLLQRTITALEEEYIRSGRAKLFEQLRGCLTPDASAVPYADIAARLKLSEAAVKMAVHRVRARYREILRAEIAQTVSTAEEVEEEIRCLLSAFGA